MCMVIAMSMSSPMMGAILMILMILMIAMGRMVVCMAGMILQSENPFRCFACVQKVYPSSMQIVSNSYAAICFFT